LIHDGTALEPLLDAIVTCRFRRTSARAVGDARGEADRERYQTIFARSPGAIAAPTAGLHLTARVLDALHERGVETASLTLHVGPGTFLPFASSTWRTIACTRRSTICPPKPRRRSQGRAREKVAS
jgi:hypothetical protein